MSARSVVEHALRAYYADSGNAHAVVAELLAQYDAGRRAENHAEAFRMAADWFERACPDVEALLPVCMCHAAPELRRLADRISPDSEPAPLVVSRYDVAMEPAPEEEPVLTVGAVAEDGRPVALLFDPEARARVAGWLAPTEAVITELLRLTRLRMLLWIAHTADLAEGPDWLGGQGRDIAAWMRRGADVLVQDGAHVPAEVQRAAADLAQRDAARTTYGTASELANPAPARATGDTPGEGT